MLQKTDTPKMPELSPAMLQILATVARNRPPYSYANIGRNLSGISKKPRGDFELVYTGNVMPMVMKRGLNGHSKEPAYYGSKVYTLMPTARKQAKELQWAKRKRMGKLLDDLLRRPTVEEH
jgi:hypothetical protein